MIGPSVSVVAEDIEVPPQHVPLLNVQPAGTVQTKVSRVLPDEDLL